MQRRITGFDCIWLLAGLKKNNICPSVVRGWELLMISQSSYVDVGVYTRMVLSKDVWKPLSGRRPSVAMAVRQLFRNRSIFNHQGSYIAFWGLLTLAHVIQCIIQFSNVTYEFQTCFRGASDSCRRTVDDVRQEPSLRHRADAADAVHAHRNNSRLPKYNYWVTKLTQKSFNRRRKTALAKMGLFKQQVVDLKTCGSHICQYLPRALRNAEVAHKITNDMKMFFIRIPRCMGSRRYLRSCISVIL